MNKLSQIRLEEIKESIKKQEGKRTTGIVLVIISLFCLWPLIIVGIILWVGANNEIKALLSEERIIKTNDILATETESKNTNTTESENTNTTESENTNTTSNTNNNSITTKPENPIDNKNTTNNQ